MHGSNAHQRGGGRQSESIGSGNTQSGMFIALMQLQAVNLEQIRDKKNMESWNEHYQPSERVCEVIFLFFFWSNQNPSTIHNQVFLSPHLSPSLCLTSSLIYLPTSNVKRLRREAGSPGADCVFELTISSYSVTLWSCGA